MKPPALSLDDIQALPLLLRTVIPPDYEDENGHMNMRWYLALFDEAGYPMVAAWGLTPEFHATHHTGDTTSNTTSTTCAKWPSEIRSPSTCAWLAAAPNGSTT